MTSFYVKFAPDNKIELYSIKGDILLCTFDDTQDLEDFADELLDICGTIEAHNWAKKLPKTFIKSKLYHYE